MRLAGKPTYAELHRWSIESSARLLGAGVALRPRARRAGPAAALINPRAHAGRAVVPGGAAQLRREPAAPTATTADAIVFWGEDRVKRRARRTRELYDLVSRLAQALRRRGRAARATASPASAEHARSRRSRCSATASLGAIWSSLLAGLRRAGRARPLRPDRAQGAVLRRRLPLRRQGVRLAGAGCARSLAQLPSVERVRGRALPRRRRIDGIGDASLRRLPRAVRRRRDDRVRAACRSTTRSTSCTRRARPACRSASCTAPAARCCST